MKIMMVSSGFYPYEVGGVETFVSELSKKLENLDFEIVVIIPSNKNLILNEKTIKIRYIKIREINGIENHFTKKINRLLHMYNIFNISLFKKIILEEDPNIVHIQMLRTFSYSIFEAIKSLNIPTIVTLHEHYSLWHFNPFKPLELCYEYKIPLICKILRTFQKKSTNFIKYITAPSENIINNYKLSGYYINSESYVIRNAIPINNKELLKNFEVKKSILSKKKFRDFLYIGRLTSDKGIDILLDAFEMVDAKNIRLHIAGTGYLEEKIKKHSMFDKRIIYHGKVSGEDKNNLFFNCDVLIFPSGENETFGLVCLEAFSYAMPIIAFNIAATRKFIENKGNGILIENDVYALKKAIEKYIPFDSWKHQMQNCIETLNTYDFDKFSDKYVQLYNKLVKE